MHFSKFMNAGIAPMKCDYVVLGSVSVASGERRMKMSDDQK